jgi:DNA-binding HxlR family transcriptional regulator
MSTRFPHAKGLHVRNQTETGNYGQFCPVAMAAEIVCAKWTALVLRELLSGSTRFNDLRRGVPKMSPTLLSKRLKELQQAGVISARASGSAGVVEYRLTAAGNDLRDVIMTLGGWGQRWIESSLSLKNLDPSLLMWDMRRNIAPSSLPDRRCTVQFTYPELPAGRNTWWLVIERGDVDLCSVDPGFDIDLYVSSTLRSMTAVWMGHTTLKAEIDAGKIALTGDKAIARSMHGWLGLSPFAKEKSRLAS